MSDFVDLADGGRALVSLLSDYAGQQVIVVAVVPNGVPAGLRVAQRLSCPCVGVVIERDEHERAIRAVRLPGLDGGLGEVDVVILADDAVESGTAALAVGAALRQVTSARLVLAVPVCPQEAVEPMAAVFDDVVAPIRPVQRQPLTAHYEQFVPVPIDEAHAILDAYAQGRHVGGVGADD